MTTTPNPSTPNVRVGTAVILQRNGRILLGERLSPHGDHTWSFPGGHLEFGESWEECVRREAMEETGMNIHDIRFITVTNDIFTETNKHYITLYMTASFDGEPQITEPEKWSTWQWFDVNNLPTPLFLPIQNLLKQQPDLWQKVIQKNNG